ncbi:MAG: VCBS repeat-containing protein [Anaerolineae bacterium]|nr:VCBS repeat-containing protein [Anaerolineae bacterium]
MHTNRIRPPMAPRWAWLLSLALAALILGAVAAASALAAPPPPADSAAAPGVEAHSGQPPAAPAIPAAPAAPAVGPTWVFQGPAPELYAQQDLINVAVDQEPVSGNVVSIAPSPTDANRVYIAGVNGGVWKTTNATAASPTWTPLGDTLQSLSIARIALDPLDATDQTLVAGVGRFSALGNNGDDLTGLYYTTNGGTNWTTTTSSLLSANSITGVFARGTTLMAASAGGLFRTTSGPLGTWTKISGTLGLPDAPARDLAADPTSTSRFYVTFTGASGGIFRTDDTGATWTNVTAGISGISGATTAINASVGASGAVFVILNNGGGAKALYRSTNLGAAWTALDMPPGTFFGATNPNGVIGADTTNANLVYVTGYETAIYRVDASQPSGQTPSQQYTNISSVSATAALNYGAPHSDNMALAFDANGALLNGNHGGVFRLGDPRSAASGANVWVSANGNLGVSEIHDVAYDPLANVLVGGLQDNGVAYQTASGSEAWTRRMASGDGGDVAVANLVLPNGTPASTTMLFTQSAAWNDIYVASAAGFPASGGFYITVDSEQMFVAGVRGAAYTIATATQSGNTVTITTAGAHGLGVGDGVNIRGVSDSRYNVGFVYIVAIPSSTTFTYTLSAYSNLPAATGGTVSSLRFQVGRGVNSTPVATHNAGASVTSLFLPGTVAVRYGSSQKLGGFKRYLFTAANDALGGADISTSIMTDKQFITPLAVNAVDPARLLIGGSANLYESLDRGDTLANIATIGVNSSPLPMAYGGYRLGVANPDVLYIGFGGAVYSRTTAGSAVTAVAALPAGAGTIADIVMDPADWKHVVVVDNDQVFRSTDGGATWSDITFGLLSVSSAEIKTVEFVSGGSPYIVVGTRSGVFASLISNLGTWVKLGNGLPDVSVFDLDFDDGDDVLAAATLGRGAWTLSGAKTAFVPSSVAPVLAMTTAPTTANEGSTQYSYSFTVTDPGDRFTVTTLTVGAGGSLAPNSLTTTASGGSFKVTFADGPATVGINLQVTDSTGLTSNTATTSVTVANVIPSAVTINGPSTGIAGAPINLTDTVTDPSAVDQAAGFTYAWFVYKPTGAASIPNGSSATYSFTPSIAGAYTVYNNATDKDGGLRQGSKVITVSATLNKADGSATTTTSPVAKVNSNAAPTTAGLNGLAKLHAPAATNLTVDAAGVTVFEGQPAQNSGTFDNSSGNPVTLSASVGAVTIVPVPTHLFRGEGNADDSIAGGASGAINGGVTFTPGQVGQAFNFPGSGGSPSSTPNVEYLATDFAPGTGDFTVALGLKTTSTGVQAVLGNRADASAGNFFGVRMSNGILDVATWQDASSTNYAFVDSSVALNDGNFHSIVVTRQGATLNLYIDGSLDASATAAAASAVNILGAYPFRLGAEQGSAAMFTPAFTGLLDEVQIYNQALSAAEVADGYHTFASGSLAPYGTWSWSYTPDDGPAQSQSVTITATDNVTSGTSNTSFSLTVNNATPTGTLSNNGPVNEGSAGQVSFSNQADPSTADTTAGFHYAYDFDNDGVFEVGDGTYAGSGTAASANVPASFLAEGPGARTVLARILDKDGGYTDYTTDITINNAAPTASVNGPATALAGQLVTFLLTATDGAATDQAAGFTYSVNWGDGSPLQTVNPVAGTGDATARHAFATAGPYTVQVTATDKDGTTSAAPASAGITVNVLTTTSLQSLIATTAQVDLAPADDAALHSQVAAINGLSAPASPVGITLVLGFGPYTGVTLSPPSNIVLDLAGTDTSDRDGTQLIGASPAVTVSAGNVFVQGAFLSTPTDSPTVLVTGGNLTLAQVWIDESSGFNTAAIKVTGSGHVDYGFDVVTNINGDGGFFNIASRSAVSFPEGIDDFLVPNLFAVNGTYVSASHRSATSLTDSPVASSVFGQSVTFTATIDVNVGELGYANGTVKFYDGATLLGPVPLQTSGGVTTASFTTSSLSVGSHTITAIYSGDNLFVSSAAEVAHSTTYNPPVLSVVTDFNGDGKGDLLWYQTSTGQSNAWFMNGPAVTSYNWLPTPPSLDWKPVATADLNGDGKADVIWRNTVTHQVNVWLMDGPAVLSYNWLATPPSVEWIPAAIGDLNHDGKDDLVWRNAATGEVNVWLMDGPAVTSYQGLPTPPNLNWQLVGSGDVNGDHKADLVWRNAATGEVNVWLMDGPAVTSYHGLSTLPNLNWILVDVGDLDHDGADDLVWHNVATGENNAWLMNNGSVASYNMLPTVSDLNWQVAPPHP